MATKKAAAATGADFSIRKGKRVLVRFGEHANKRGEVESVDSVTDTASVIVDAQLAGDALADVKRHRITLATSALLALQGEHA